MSAGVDVAFPAGVRSNGRRRRRSPDYVVTLVHGTFARGAAWTRDGSALRAIIRDRLGEGSVQFDSFLWSGFNADQAHQKASRELRGMIGRRLDEHPGARHYVVAHSHGGNVVLNACTGGRTTAGSLAWSASPVRSSIARRAKCESRSLRCNQRR